MDEEGDRRADKNEMVKDLHDDDGGEEEECSSQGRGGEAGHEQSYSFYRTPRFFTFLKWLGF